MAVSYVLVTAAAVVLVEAVVLGILLPRILASSARSSQAGVVAQEAWSDARLVSGQVAKISATLGPGTSAGALMKVLAEDSELHVLGLAGPGGKARAPGDCRAPANVRALISADGRVISSSAPARCPIGTRLSFAIRPGLAGQGTAAAGRREIVWAMRPVVYLGPAKRSGSPALGPSAAAPSSPASSPTGKAAPAKLDLPSNLPPRLNQILGGVYAAAPAGSGGVSFAQVRSLLLTGGVVLALLIPAGAVFGLLSTRQVIRRIKRLAAVTGTVAGGDFRPRVEVSGDDEIGRLEDAFNRMTGRLSAALDSERVRAGADARQAERARIARELHDSISQDLFSLSLLAAGLR
jgi:HAMP domain-containing protein